MSCFLETELDKLSASFQEVIPNGPMDCSSYFPHDPWLLIILRKTRDHLAIITKKENCMSAVTIQKHNAVIGFDNFPYKS
ncbi:MAG: hypothetical protein AAGC85_00430, partial [Bacteroidota bacterium]